MVDEVTVDGRRLALAIPLTYMNLSGEAVAPLVRRHGIDDPHHLVIVHDELDLPVGTPEGEGRRRTGRQQRPQVDQGSTSTPTTSSASASASASRTSKTQGADHVLKKPGKGDRGRARHRRAGGRRRRGAHPHRRPRRGDEPLQHPSRSGGVAAREPSCGLPRRVVDPSTLSGVSGQGEHHADGEATSRRTTWSLMSGGEPERNRPRSSIRCFGKRRVAHGTQSTSTPDSFAHGEAGRRSQDPRGRARRRPGRPRADDVPDAGRVGHPPARATSAARTGTPAGTRATRGPPRRPPAGPSRPPTRPSRPAAASTSA